MPTRVLLSIKPQYAEAILDGSKKFEFRRAIFRQPDISTIVVYASTPVREVVGEFKVGNILALEPSLLWAKTCRGAGISKAYFDEYFDGCNVGYAIAVAETRRYRTPRSLGADFAIATAPQSFCYL
jgi:predicted transcriptional regulator